MFNREEEEDIEDAEFVDLPPEAYGPAPSSVPPQQAQSQAQPVPYPNLDIISGLDTPEYRLMRYERRARAVTIFIRLPLLTLVALNDDTPSLLRLGAGLMALWEAGQLARNFGEVQAVATEWQQA